MKIAMLGQKGIPAQSGGIEQAVDMLSQNLTARGHEVMVYCRRSYEPGGKSSRDGGLHRIFRPSVPTKHLDAITHTLASTLDVLLRRADIVHYHAIGPAALAPLARLARYPVVVTVHGLDWQRAKWGTVARNCLKAGERVASLAANQLVVVSPILKQYYQDQFGVASHFIPNGVVPIERSRPDRMLSFGLQPKKYVLAVARLVPEKGLHYLIEAFTKTSGDTKLVIAGGGGLDASYEHHLRSLANDRVVFTGPADRGLLAELYSHARLFVLPSDLEGMSIALLEAMSMGLPILVSDIPENTTVIGDSGESFAAGNVAALREKLEEMLARPERLDVLGRLAAEQAEPFQWPNVVDQLEAVYEQCLVGRKSRRSAARPVLVPQQA
jgi:glycosyltransferase involved in cell wall biosynthesis